VRTRNEHRRRFTAGGFGTVTLIDRIVAEALS
jgi:hypothetical protein